MLTFAASCTSGSVIHTLVKMPSVWASPGLLARYAEAVVLPPPGLLSTLSRTGASFSCSIIAANARANRSFPDPGPPCTTRSHVFDGLKSAHVTAGPPITQRTTAPVVQVYSPSIAFLQRLLPRDDPFRRVGPPLFRASRWPRT